MATKRTKTAPPSKAGNVLNITGRKGKTTEQDIAWAALDPMVTAGCYLADQFKSLPNVDTNAFIDELRQHSDAANRGDLSRGEEMLAAQAHALNALFYSMVNRSAANSKEGYLGAAETYMKLGLRAQAQCRSTWEALAEIKNPRQVAFVKQANVGNNVQVNNGTAASRPREDEIAPSKLLEASDGERMDTRAPGTAGGANSELETVGALNRSEDVGR